VPSTDSANWGGTGSAACSIGGPAGWARPASSRAAPPPAWANTRTNSQHPQEAGVEHVPTGPSRARQGRGDFARAGGNGREGTPDTPVMKQENFSTRQPGGGGGGADCRV